MKVYKFGGASVKNAKGVKNLLNVLVKIEAKNCVLIVSAMGKMTNAFEKIVDAYFNNKNTINKNLNITKVFHLKIANQLFKDKNHLIFNEIDLIFSNLNNFLINNNRQEHDFVYDQIVPFAEIISS